MNMPARRKILFVITKSNWGGAQQYVYTLATHFIQTGNDVLVALGGTGEPGAPTGLLAERLQEADVPIIFVPSFTRDISLLQEIKSFFELLRIFRKVRPDVLHLNSSKAGGIGALAGRLTSIRTIVFTAHGWAHRETRTVFSRVFIWLTSWMTIILSHKTIVVSAFDYQDAPVFFSRRNIRVIHNGIDTHIQPLTKQEALDRLKETIPILLPDTPIILSIGELTKNKAHEILIGALARVTTPFFCSIIGEGEERPTLERLIEKYKLGNRITLPGFVPDAAKLLPAADLFILPSRKEGLPFTLLEAGTAACPVIATQTGGIPEITNGEQAGLLFPKEDVQALATSIERLLQDTPLRKRMGDALRTRVHRLFTEEQMLRQTGKVYE